MTDRKNEEATQETMMQPLPTSPDYKEESMGRVLCCTGAKVDDFETQTNKQRMAKNGFPEQQQPVVSSVCEYHARLVCSNPLHSVKCLCGILALLLVTAAVTVAVCAHYFPSRVLLLARIELVFVWFIYAVLDTLIEKVFGVWGSRCMSALAIVPGVAVLVAEAAHGELVDYLTLLYHVVGGLPAFLLGFIGVVVWTYLVKKKQNPVLYFSLSTDEEWDALRMRIMVKDSNGSTNVTEHSLFLEDTSSSAALTVKDPKGTTQERLIQLLLTSSDDCGEKWMAVMRSNGIKFEIDDFKVVSNEQQPRLSAGAKEESGQPGLDCARDRNQSGLSKTSSNPLHSVKFLCGILVLLVVSAVVTVVVVDHYYFPHTSNDFYHRVLLLGRICIVFLWCIVIVAGSILEKAFGRCVAFGVAVLLIVSGAISILAMIPIKDIVDILTVVYYLIGGFPTFVLAFVSVVVWTLVTEERRDY